MGSSAGHLWLTERNFGSHDMKGSLCVCARVRACVRAVDLVRKQSLRTTFNVRALHDAKSLVLFL
jgi:hypothetical protein